MGSFKRTGTGPGRQFGVVTVAVLVTLLVATSGTAVATTALLVTKNKQVASHVIAGANAPKGDNHNLIPGSVGSSDLHAGAVGATQIGSNAVTGKAVAKGSLTGADLANGSVSSSKIKLPSFNQDSSATSSDNNPPTQPLVTAANLSLAYVCTQDSNSGALDLELLASSTASGASFNGVALSSTLSVVETLTQAGSGSNSMSGFQTYLQGQHVTLVHLDESEQNALTSGTCHIDGLELPSN